MKNDSRKCPRFMHIFGSGVFGKCTAILQAKKYRSRRKPDLPVDKEDPRSIATACTTMTINGISKKTGLSNSKSINSKILRRRATGDLALNGNPQSASVDVSVADAMDQSDIERICRLPERFDRNEWLATHILTLFDHVNALCGTVSEVCTPVSCHVMSCPGAPKVNWVDERGKRHNYSAMRYIDSVMSFCEASRKNQQIFPTKFGMTFSVDFDAQCRRMMRLLWHCCGHLYDKHWDYLCVLSLRSQYALVLAHFTTVAQLYDMLEAKELQSTSTTLQAVRKPTCLPKLQPTFGSEELQRKSKQPRPAKRLSSCNVDDESDGDAPTTKTSGGLTKATKASLFWPDSGPLAHLFSSPKPSTNEATTVFNKWPTVLNATVLTTMKSGSWGGHNSDAFQLENVGANTTRSFKNFVQTY